MLGSFGYNDFGNKIRSRDVRHECSEDGGGGGSAFVDVSYAMERERELVLNVKFDFCRVHGTPTPLAQHSSVKCCGCWGNCHTLITLCIIIVLSLKAHSASFPSSSFTCLHCIFHPTYVYVIHNICLCFKLKIKL